MLAGPWCSLVQWEACARLAPCDEFAASSSAAHHYEGAARGAPPGCGVPCSGPVRDRRGTAADNLEQKTDGCPGDGWAQCRQHLRVGAQQLDERHHETHWQVWVCPQRKVQRPVLTSVVPVWQRQALVPSQQQPLPSWPHLWIVELPRHSSAPCLGSPAVSWGLWR